jgi:hypothetical protein
MLEAIEDPSELADSLPAIVAEVLLAACHEDQGSVRVAELTDAANALLLARGERTRLTPRGLGAILRNPLGLTPHRRERGFVVDLDRGTRARIHRLVDSLGTLSRLTFPGCEFCNSPHGVQNVQNVQDASTEASLVVQDVQPVQHVQSEVGDAD